MNPRTRRTCFSLSTPQVFAAVVLLSAVSLPVFAVKSDKVMVRESVSESHREELARRLRVITGWNDLTFDPDGALRFTNAITTNGSSSARDLLSRATSGGSLILFEDASARKDVVFCRVVLTRLLGNRSIERTVNVVLIDFTDFRQVIGDKQAQAAFDVGWAVLHEIDHVVEDSEDPRLDNSAGDCEARINKMRQELGLPVRANYFFTLLPVRTGANLVSRFVRLGFVQGNGASARRYWLIWDAAVVGGLPSDRQSEGATALSSSFN